MKKYIYSLALLLVICINTYADGLTATLQQGDTFKYYSGKAAFAYAYNAAEDGAIITLSPGTFTDVASIKKQITIIGSSAFETDQSKNTILNSIVIACDSVKIEGIHFMGNVTLCTKDRYVRNIILKRCWVQLSLLSDNYNYNTIIDQCVLRSGDRAIAKGINYCLKNSTVKLFHELNDPANLAYITNCVIWNFSNFSSTYNSSEDDSYKKPYAIYRNNLLGVHNNKSDNAKYLDLKSPSEFYNNVFFANDYSATILNVHFDGSTGSDVVMQNNSIVRQNFKHFQPNDNYIYPAEPINPPLGSDGTFVGPYGGTGFSLYPAIPRITSKKIDSYTNSEGKIRVQISVVAEQ